MFFDYFCNAMLHNQKLYKMETIRSLFDSMPWLLPVIAILALWDGIWKLIGLWKSARNDHMVWFIIIALINSIGIIPIIYILKNKNRKERDY